ncbi:hypothetical protein PT2222_80291 [Paraburkholderia tropica]
MRTYQGLVSSMVFRLVSQIVLSVYTNAENGIGKGQYFIRRLSEISLDYLEHLALTEPENVGNETQTSLPRVVRHHG